MSYICNLKFSSDQIKKQGNETDIIKHNNLFDVIYLKNHNFTK